MVSGAGRPQAQAKLPLRESPSLSPFHASLLSGASPGQWLCPGLTSLGNGQFQGQGGSLKCDKNLSLTLKPQPDIAFLCHYRVILQPEKQTTISVCAKQNKNALSPHSVVRSRPFSCLASSHYCVAFLELRLKSQQAPCPREAPAQQAGPAMGRKLRQYHLSQHWLPGSPGLCGTMRECMLCSRN